MTQDFYCETARKARKEHTCYWCGDTILKGDHYYYVRGVYEGDFSARKECAVCNNLIENYSQENRDGVDHDGLIDYWQWERCRKCQHFNIIDRECGHECDGMTHRTKCVNFIWDDSL